MDKIATFERGIHPEYHKELTSNKPVTEAKLPQRIVIPLSQHIGAPCKAEVNIGDEVKKGQVIGVTTSFVSSPVPTADCPERVFRGVPTVRCSFPEGGVSFP